MNKSGNENRSVRNTRRKLRESLLELMKEKPIQSISVKELTELANVNRGTFYFHYSDVQDMLQQIEEDFFSRFHDILSAVQPGESDPSQDYIPAIFRFLGENSDLCRVLLGSHGDMDFLTRTLRLVGDRCTDLLRSAVPGASSRQYDMYNAFIIHGCIGMMLRWLDSGMTETPEEIARLASAAILSSARAYFQSA